MFNIFNHPVFKHFIGNGTIEKMKIRIMQRGQWRTNLIGWNYVQTHIYSELDTLWCISFFSMFLSTYFPPLCWLKQVGCIRDYENDKLVITGLYSFSAFAQSSQFPQCLPYFCVYCYPENCGRRPNTYKCYKC